MENQDIFKREKWEVFLPNSENPDNLIEMWKEKFRIKEVKINQEDKIRTFILECVGEDK
jgi:hypothetical protein